MMIEHRLVGPGPVCEKCGSDKPHRARKRPQHLSVGDPCRKCGEEKSRHPTKAALRKRKAFDAKRTDRQSARTIVGVDGEGYDVEINGVVEHRYVYLCAANETGRIVAEDYDPRGLSHERCVAVLLAIPKNTLCFWFGGGYDVTKILEGVPKGDIYRILRADTRKSVKDGKTLISHHRYQGRGYDYFNGAFTVKAGRKKGARKTKVWEAFRFFLTSFVAALEKWKVGTPEQRERIATMKDLRGKEEFSKDPERMKDYCREECHLLAVLMRKVLQAHEKANLKLERYDGAGSTAQALLKREEIERYLGPPIDDDELRHAVMAAYFGGRFENSVVGLVQKPLQNRDVCSAYPYAESVALPCLAHGTWRKVEGKGTLRAMRQATLAVGRYVVLPASDAERETFAWGPLPNRDKKGSIAFGFNCRGWSWWPELSEALALYPHHVKVECAWIFEAKCKHRPFRRWPDIYRKRVELGKDGAGLVLKNGLNGTAGKTMQSKGSAPYANWVWAGNITATTRGQLLRAIRAHRDPWNVLAVATDGLVTTELGLKLPRPKDTGTRDLKDEKGKSVELGSWDTKDVPEGGFFLCPGRFFRLKGMHDPKSKEGLDETRARGIGRREVQARRGDIVRDFLAWDRKGPHKYVIETRRFFGAKSSVKQRSRCSACNVTWEGIPKVGCPKCRQVGDGSKMVDVLAQDKRPAYGRWCETTIDLGYEQLPKRDAMLPSEGEFSRLRVRDLGGHESLPYVPGTTTPEGEAAADGKRSAEEQPDIGADAAEEAGGEAA